MCWLDPDPASPYECIVCHTVRTMHSSTVEKLPSKLDAAYNEKFTTLVTLPECTRNAYTRLLKHECHLGPQEKMLLKKGAATDSGLGSDMHTEADGPVISEKTGRRIISNVPLSSKRKRDSDDEDTDTTEPVSPRGSRSLLSASETWHGKPQQRRTTASERYGLSSDDEEEEEEWPEDDEDMGETQSEMSTSSSPKRRRCSRSQSRRKEQTQDRPRYRMLRNVIDDDETMSEEGESDYEFDAGPEAFLSASPTGGVATEDHVGVPLGVRRLLRFLDVMDLFTAPFAPIQFKENQEMLTELIATHLKLITGKAEYRKHKTQLFAILGTDPDLIRKKNVIWITNRQQGKTSTFGKFLAVLSYLSPVGGNLAFVYSTSRDKAQDLVDAARKYLNWAQTTEHIIERLAEYGLRPPRYRGNNATTYKLYSATNSIAINIVKARPKSAEYCRGDASETVIIDEFGFVEKKFWDEFALPLTQVKDRTFAMATTPAPLGSFADEFTKKCVTQNEKGDLFMSLTNHSLACKECIENERQRECAHRLYLIPPWKSLFGLDQISEYVSLKDRETYEKECFGIIAREGGRFYKPALISKIFGHTRTKKIKGLPQKVVLYVSVDPPSHEVSNMGLSAHIFNKSGKIYVVGLSEVPMEACQTQEMELVAAKFTTQVITQLTYEGIETANITVIPIVECVNNDFIAGGIVKSIRSFAAQYGTKTFMPFTRQFFNEAISEDVGVWTNKKTKPGYIQNMISLFVDNRVAVSKRCVTIGSVHTKSYRTPSLKETLDTMCAQLKQWKNTDKGPSGVSAATYDDMSLAMKMGFYWSHAFKMTLSLQSSKRNKDTPQKVMDRSKQLPIARFRDRQMGRKRDLPKHDDLDKTTFKVPRKITPGARKRQRERYAQKRRASQQR